MVLLGMPSCPKLVLPPSECGENKTNVGHQVAAPDKIMESQWGHDFFTFFVHFFFFLTFFFFTFLFLHFFRSEFVLANFQP